MSVQGYVNLIQFCFTTKTSRFTYQPIRLEMKTNPDLFTSIFSRLTLVSCKLFPVLIV